MVTVDEKLYEKARATSRVYKLDRLINLMSGTSAKWKHLWIDRLDETIRGTISDLWFANP